MINARTILSICAWVLGCLIASEIIADELADRVHARLIAESPSVLPSIRNLNEISVTGPQGEMSVFLDNVRAACVARPSECDAEINSFAKRIVSAIHNGTQTLPFVAEKVLPVLRHKEFVRSSQESIGGDRKKRLVTRAFLNGIEVMYVLDSPTSVSFLNFGDLESVGISPETLHELAVSNTRTLKPLPIEPLRDTMGVYFAIAVDGLGTSRIFDAQFWIRVETQVGGPAVIATPTRDWILAAKSSDVRAVNALRTIAGRIVRGEPYAVSDTPFIKDGQVWRRIDEK